MTEKRILQFCHCHYGPFLDIARQYAVLFKDTPYKVTTVYLTDEKRDDVIHGSASDEVLFMAFEGREVRGLKLNAMRALRRIITQHEWAMIIAHRFKPIYTSCMATRLPVIGVHHAFGDYNRLSHRLFARAFHSRLRLLGVSDAIRDDLRQGLPSWPADQIDTLHNHIDVNQVRSEILPKASARSALGLPEDVYIIGNVGRLHPDKDQTTLLHAFAQSLPHLPSGSLLVIMGQGRLEKPLKTLTQTLGISSSVRFLGQVPHARRHFAAFDLFALSSDHEPFGMVLLEAMAAGVPVIGTDCGGAPEVIGNPAALFPLGNIEALAQLFIQYATQTETQRSVQAEQMLDRLNTLFSDDAARRRFFSLPMVKEILDAPSRTTLS